jgi:hypothetical protein
MTENARLAADPKHANTALSRDEYQAAQRNPKVARLQYGNAIERLAAKAIRRSALHRQLFKHIGGPGRPDFIGCGLAAGMNFDITTPPQIPTHLNRPRYGRGLLIATYQRPASFTVFP